MAAQAGKAVLIKMSNQDSPETFSTIGGQRSSSITINDEPVDITNKDSTNRWRELIRKGIRNVEISGSGVFLDDTVIGNLNTHMMNTADDIINFQFIVPDFGTFEGAFFVASLSYAGEHDGEATYESTFQSAGAVTFTAV